MYHAEVWTYQEVASEILTHQKVASEVSMHQKWHLGETCGRAWYAWVEREREGERVHTMQGCLNIGIGYSVLAHHRVYIIQGYSNIGIGYSILIDHG